MNTGDDQGFSIIIDTISFMGLLEKSVILKCDELAHAKTGIREQRNDCFATPRKIHMEGIDFRAGSRDHDVPSNCLTFREF